MNQKIIHKPEIAEKMFWHCRTNFRSQRAAAKHYQVSDAFMSAVCKGLKTPNQKMLDDIGLTKISGFLENEHENSNGTKRPRPKPKRAP